MPPEEQTWALTARSSGTPAGSANRTPTPVDTLWLQRALLLAVLRNPCLSSLWKEAYSGERQGTCLGRCPGRKWWGPVWGCGQGQRRGQAQQAVSSAGNNRSPGCQGLCHHSQQDRRQITAMSLWKWQYVSSGACWGWLLAALLTAWCFPLHPHLRPPKSSTPGKAWGHTES